MFPTPIAKTAPWVQMGYKIILPVALIVWLLPLIGIAMTSIRPSADLAAGNYTVFIRGPGITYVRK